MKGNLTKIIIQALIGGVICWFAFAFGTAFGMIGCFLGYWNKSRQ